MNRITPQAPASLDDGKLELGDHMCVARVVDSNYSDDPYSESVSNYLVTADQRSATVSSHEQTFHTLLSFPTADCQHAGSETYLL